MTRKPVNKPDPVTCETCRHFVRDTSGSSRNVDTGIYFLGICALGLTPHSPIKQFSDKPHICTHHVTQNNPTAPVQPDGVDSKRSSTSVPAVEKTPDQPKKEAPFKLPLWVVRKALKEDLSIQQLIAYWWLYTHNAIARSRKKDDRIIFGKSTYDSIHMAIKTEYGISRADHACAQLESKGWIKKALAPEFCGKRQVGYLCLLVESDRRQARAVQQELHLADEEAVIAVPSALPDNGEYMKFGIRYYDYEGQPHQIPSSAPPRPTPTAVWSSDPEGWFEPDEVPEHDLEY